MRLRWLTIKRLCKQRVKDGSIVSNGLVPKGFAENPETGKDYVEDRGDLLTYNVEEAQKN